MDEQKEDRWIYRKRIDGDRQKEDRWIDINRIDG